MTKKRKSLFWCVTLVLFGLLASAGVWGLFYLWDFLEEYELSTPRTAGEELLALYREGEYGKAMSLVGVDASVFFDEAQYPAYVREALGDFEDVQIQEGSLEGKRAVFLIGEEGRSLRFFLGEGKALRYGMHRLSLEEEPVPTRGYTVSAPGHVAVTVNGTPLSASFQTGVEPAEDFPPLPEELAPPQRAVYRVEGFTQEPEFALDCDASLYRREEKAGRISFDLFVQDEETERFALEAAQTYAKFVSADVELEALLPYLYPDTVFSRAVQNYSNIWYNSHSGMEFDKLVVENPVDYSGDWRSVDIAFEYVIYRGSSENRWAEWRYPTRYRVYLIGTGSGWKVLDIRGMEY